MKIIKTLARLLVLAGISVGIIMIMGKNKNTFTSEGYIGQNNIVIEDGKMTPEVLLALGRLSDPQVSPDGEHILYGVSYTSTKNNRSFEILFPDSVSCCLSEPSFLQMKRFLHDLLFLVEV